MAVPKMVFALSVCALAGCATSGEFSGVNHDPYTVPVNIGQDDSRLGDLRYPGRGSYAYDAQGNRVRLSDRERRQLRERFRNVQAQIKQNELVAEFDARNAGPPEPIPSAPPIATGEKASGDSGRLNPREPSRGGGSLPR